jgi:uncharacterized protein (DUF2252 family)
MDVALQIHQFNAGRDPERLAIKYQKMRRDAFGFMRGTCHLFYERAPKSGLFKSTPLVWACGDLHLENFGSYKGDNRLVYFDLNDFDESALAPASWDLVRMLASILVGAGSLSIKADDARHLCSGFLNAYFSAFGEGKAYWVEHRTAQGMVKDLLDGLDKRQRGDHLNARTHLKGKTRWLDVDGKKTLPASAEDRARVMAFMEGFAQTQNEPDFYQPLDVARRVAGTGSLGLARFVILIHGKGSPDGHYLLDLKEARPSALIPWLKSPQPAWPSEAHRTVALTQRVQAVPMAFLHAVMLDGAPHVLRGLQPSEDRISLNGERHTPAQMASVITTMGQLVAWGQLRSAGRQGSATADELIDFAMSPRRPAQLMEAALQCAQQVQKDAADFNRAYDDGVFHA